MNKLHSGFTLIELLVTITILSALATFTVFRFVGSQEGAQDTKRVSELKQYQVALEVYANGHNYLYPIRTSATNAISLCGGGSAPLGDIGCTDDPDAPSQHYLYQSDSRGFQYVLWVKLKKPTVDTWQVYCSNGKAAQATSGIPPSGGNCPI